MSALTRGDVSEWRATIVARETTCLSREDRTRTDAEIASRLGRLGDKRLGDTVRGIAQRLDPASCVRRMRKAVGQRRISVRPAPDTMSCLTGLLPAAQGVAVYAALKREADSLRGQGDVRTAAQLMADVLVERVTGASSQRASAIEIQLVMTDRTLLQGDPEPGYLAGFGPVPATLARRLVRDADKAWIRRLFTGPGAGDLVARLPSAHLRRQAPRPARPARSDLSQPLVRCPRPAGRPRHVLAQGRADHARQRPRAL